MNFCTIRKVDPKKVKIKNFVVSIKYKFTIG